jgi:hypothetical protein
MAGNNKQRPGIQGKKNPGKCTLSDLRPGEQAMVVSLEAEDPGQLRTLMALSVLPGLLVRSVQNFPTAVYQAGYFQFALDERLGRQVRVRRTGQSGKEGS